MKLNKTTLDLIESVVTAAKLVGIDSVIIEEGRIRGMDENRTVVLFQEENVPKVEAGQIGLNRTDVFTSRLSLIKDAEDFTVTADINEEKGFVRSLRMKAKGTKIDYRCAAPVTIKAPRVINDEMVAHVKLNEEVVTMLQKAAAAMGNAEVVTLKSDKNGISFSIEDITSDTFTHTFAEVVDHQFSHKYPVKTLLSLFKNDNTGTFGVGQKGILRFETNGVGIFVLPKV